MCCSDTGLGYWVPFGTKGTLKTLSYKELTLLSCLVAFWALDFGKDCYEIKKTTKKTTPAMLNLSASFPEVVNTFTQTPEAANSPMMTCLLLINLTKSTCFPIAGKEFIAGKKFATGNVS
jgi:hypothetical protein